ncbi:MAG TPA: hypothetical protein DEW46_15030, partial [Verrucomicrobia bacterium]|nr:hypothetical protein [Verrucomicrobiota bacterium]
MGIQMMMAEVLSARMAAETVRLVRDAQSTAILAIAVCMRQRQRQATISLLQSNQAILVPVPMINVVGVWIRVSDTSRQIEYFDQNHSSGGMGRDLQNDMRLGSRLGTKVYTTVATIKKTP